MRTSAILNKVYLCKDVFYSCKFGPCVSQHVFDRGQSVKVQRQLHAWQLFN